MPFEPPKPTSKISPTEKQKVLTEYIEHYRGLAQTHPDLLRIKLRRSQIQPFLDEIGEHVLRLAKQIGTEAGAATEHGQAVRQFLESNPIPGTVGQFLTMELRAYALLVHGLHQWAVGQSLATDRWVISGNARHALRSSTDRCVVTNEPFGEEPIELHHPARDGRPPIPVSKKGHKIADEVFDPQDPQGRLFVAVKKKLRFSWRSIWQGCRVSLDLPVSFEAHANPDGRRTAAVARARRFARETAAPMEGVLEWIEENDLVEVSE